MSNNVNVLDQVILVQLDIRRSDLESKLDREVDIDATTLPPKSIVSAGVKRYVDPKAKAVFDTIAKRAERACKKVGYPVLRAWAIPPEKAPELQTELDKLAVEYRDAADQLQKDLPRLYAEWEAANPGYEELIRRGRPDGAKVRGRFHFRHVMYRLKEASDESDSPINDGLDMTRGSLIFGLLDDVATTAQSMHATYFGKGKRPTRHLVNGLQQLGDKIASFSLMDPLLGAVSAYMGEVLFSVGTTRSSLGPLESASLRSLLDLLSDPAEVRTRGLELVGDVSPAATLEVDEVVESEQPAQPARQDIAPQPATASVDALIF